MMKSYLNIRNFAAAKEQENFHTHRKQSAARI